MSVRKKASKTKTKDVSNLLPEEQLIYHVKNNSKVSVLNKLFEEFPDIDLNHCIFDPSLTDDDFENDLSIFPLDSPITIACRMNHSEVLKWLCGNEDLDKFVKIEKRTTAFHIASTLNNEQLVRILLLNEEDIDINSSGLKNEEGRTPFEISLFVHNNPSICSLYLKKGTRFDFDQLDEHGRCLLHQAAYEGNTKLLECLLTIEEDPMKKDSKGNTILHLLYSNVENNSPKTTLDMINKKIKISSQMLQIENEDGRIPLLNCLYIHPNYQDNAKNLIKLGSNINHVSTKTGKTVLQSLVDDNEIEKVSAILSAFKVKINLKDVKGNTALHYCKSKEVFQSLMEKKIDINMKNDEEYPPLFTFIERGQKELVECLSCEKKLVLKTTSNRNENILHLCSRFKQLEIMKLLHEKLANKLLIEEESVDNETPIETAINSDNEEGAIFLLQNDAKILRNGKNLLYNAVCRGLSNLVVEMVKRSQSVVNLINEFQNEKNTALHVATKKNDYKTIEAFITKFGESIELDIFDKEEKSTPLMTACKNGFEEIALLFLKAGSSPNFPDSEGKIALHYASGSKNVEFLKTLIDMGSLINHQDNFGKTPLHEACQSNNGVFVDYLIQKKADIEIKDKKGTSPLHLSVSCGSEISTQILLRNNVNLLSVDDSGRIPLVVASQTKNTACGRLIIKEAKRRKEKVE